MSVISYVLDYNFVMKQNDIPTIFHEKNSMRSPKSAHFLIHAFYQKIRKKANFWAF